MIFVNPRIKSYKVNTCDMFLKDGTIFKTVTHSVLKMALEKKITLELEKNRANQFISSDVFKIDSYECLVLYPAI